MAFRSFIVAYLAALIFFSFSENACNAAAMEAKTMAYEQIRESVIAGSWYPGEASRLQQEIKGYLKRASVAEFQGNLIALISPHAGYRYSGQVAAYAYKTLEKQQFATVVVIAPSHRAYFKGVSVYDRGGYRTPLGVMALDHELVSELKQKDSRIHYVPEAHTKNTRWKSNFPSSRWSCPNANLYPLLWVSKVSPPASG